MPDPNNEMNMLSRTRISGRRRDGWESWEGCGEVFGVRTLAEGPRSTSRRAQF